MSWDTNADPQLVMGTLRALCRKTMYPIKNYLSLLVSNRSALDSAKRVKQSVAIIIHRFLEFQTRNRPGRYIPICQNGVIGGSVGGRNPGGHVGGFFRLWHSRHVFV